MKKAVKWFLYAISILAMVGYGVYEVVKPLRLDLIMLTPQDVAVTFRETGTVVAAEKRDVYTQAALTILSVRVSEGDIVSSGEVLVTLDTTPLLQQLSSIEAQIANVDSSRSSQMRTLKDRAAQQQLALAEARRLLSVASAEFERVNTLYATGGASKAELDAAKNQVSALSSTIQQIEKDLSQLRSQMESGDSETDQLFVSQIQVLQTQADAIRSDLKKAEVIAPIDGIVANIDCKVGQPAMPQMPLLQILGKGEKQVEVFILAEDVKDIRNDMEVQILQEGRSSDMLFTGKVMTIAPSAEERFSNLGLVEKRVKVVLTASELSDMVEGSDVEVTFTTQTEKQVLVVPKTAVFKQDGADTIWVVSDGKAVQKPVETGLETDLEYVITSGLSEGDRIVRSPNVEGLTVGKNIVAK